MEKGQELCIQGEPGEGLCVESMINAYECSDVTVLPAMFDLMPC